MHNYGIELSQVLDKLIEANHKTSCSLRSIIPSCKFDLNEKLEPLNDSDQEQKGLDSDFEEDEDLDEPELKQLQNEIKISIEKFNVNKTDVERPKRSKSIKMFQIEDQQSGIIENSKHGSTSRKKQKKHKNIQVNQLSQSNYANQFNAQ